MFINMNGISVNINSNNGQENTKIKDPFERVHRERLKEIHGFTKRVQGGYRKFLDGVYEKDVSKTNEGLTEVNVGVSGLRSVGVTDIPVMPDRKATEADLTEVTEETFKGLLAGAVEIERAVKIAYDAVQNNPI